jgi:uncharacterized OB-fold protein
MPQQREAAVVTAAATYFPSLARTTGRGTVTVCNGDEDAITLAVSAGLGCAPAATGRIEQVFVVLGHSPLRVGPVAEIVRESLGLPAGVACTTVLEDDLGAINVLLSAIDQVNLGRSGSCLVVVAEGGDGRSVGACAVAVLVELAAANGGIAINGSRSEGAVIYGRWSGENGASSRADPRFLDASLIGPVRRLLDWPGAEAADVNMLAVSGDLPAAIRADLREQLPTVELGDCGVTGPILALLAGARLAIVDRPFLCLSTSPARTSLIRASVTGIVNWLPETKAPEAAPRAPEQAAAPALSLPTSSPFFARSARELLRLEAGKCDACGHVAFPPAQRPICAACGGSNWTAHQMSRVGTVYTFTVNRFLPAGFGEQMVMILGEMSDGSRYWAPASGIPGGDVSIGMAVELHIRRYTQADGIPAYAMKFTLPRYPAAVIETSH